MSYRPDPSFSPAAAGANADERAALLDLVRCAQAGDLAAQSQLVRRYTKRIFGFVRPMISQPSAVEDVVQSVFIKMIRRLGLLRDPATFEGWLFILARNTAVDFIRRARCQPTMVSDDGEFRHTPDTSSARALPEIMEALEIALARLSPKDSNLVRLIVQGHSYRTAAAREGLSLSAVKLRLNRVRPFLRASVNGAIGRPAPIAEKFCLPPCCRRAA